MDTVTKISDTRIKVTTTIDQEVSLSSIKKQRQENVKFIENLDKQYKEQRDNAVNIISKLDNIISEAEKAGVKEEEVKK